jgi:hypothetical protein
MNWKSPSGTSMIPYGRTREKPREAGTVRGPPVGDLDLEPSKMGNSSVVERRHPPQGPISRKQRLRRVMPPSGYHLTQRLLSSNTGNLAQLKPCHSSQLLPGRRQELSSGLNMPRGFTRHAVATRSLRFSTPVTMDHAVLVIACVDLLFSFSCSFFRPLTNHVIALLCSAFRSNRSISPANPGLQFAFSGPGTPTFFTYLDQPRHDFGSRFQRRRQSALLSAAVKDNHSGS